MFDHIGIVVANLEISRRFYSACLAPLGISLLENNSLPSGERWLVYGTRGQFPFLVVAGSRPSFWRELHRPSLSPDHLAFTADSASAVDAFYHAGLEEGGTDHGKPGPRSSSTPYYAAYLIDPDGNNVEAGYRGGAA